MRRVLVPLLVLSAAPASGAVRNIEGDWLVEDRTALVRIAPCGDRLCGDIAKILAKGPDVPKTDIHNPDPALRSRPFEGLRILTGFVPKGNGWSGGRIYDPNSGRTYSSNLKLNADGSLKVSGCIAFFCRSQRWTRAR